MSVYIHGFEMPKSCNECRKVFGCLESGGDGTEWCRLAKGYVGDERQYELIPCWMCWARWLKAPVEEVEK